MRKKLQSIAVATAVVTALAGSAFYVHAADPQKPQDHREMMQGGPHNMMGMMNMMQQMRQMMESCNSMMQQHSRGADLSKDQKNPAQKPERAIP